MGKSTISISMAIFHCYVSSPEGKQNGVATTGNWVNPTAKANNFLLTASPATAAVVGIGAAAADGAVDTAVTT